MGGEFEVGAVVDSENWAQSLTLYDADQHYYEARDCFTRHLDPQFRSEIRWISLEGRDRLIVGDRLFRMITNPGFDLVAKPGALQDYFRGNNAAGRDVKSMMTLEPVRSEYFDRSSRVTALNAQGVAGALLLPTLALGIEELLHDNPPAIHAAFRAFNRWVDEDWGLSRDNRIVASALITLVDPELAEIDLQLVVDAGARAICLRPAPVASPSGSRSPADPIYDRFWSLVEEANVVTVFHGADSGYSYQVAAWGEVTQFRGYREAPLTEVMSLHIERPIFDTLAALIVHGLFDRHPRLRIATVELGSGWVAELIRRMSVTYGKMPQAFAMDPVESFREHVWVTPFHEDRIDGLVDLIGPDRVLLGSDWPHPEGIVEPRDFLVDLKNLNETVQHSIAAANLRRLLFDPL